MPAAGMLLHVSLRDVYHAVGFWKKNGGGERQENRMRAYLITVFVQSENSASTMTNA
jgi:hypothetical protein